MGYNDLYQKETELFGEVYPEFEKFVASHAKKGGIALDLGCGQGRDALMLARHGYQVVGVDSSEVGINQLVSLASDGGLDIQGVVADFYEYEIDYSYDAIVLDSILHFGKADQEKENSLLNRLISCLNEGGHLFIFVHKSAQKERILHSWLKPHEVNLNKIEDRYISYVYEEKSTDFKSSFEMYMLVLQRNTHAR
ncbi:MAG: class I SAM-dependent methyltransferase [Chloroflexota bacterium]